MKNLTIALVLALASATSINAGTINLRSCDNAGIGNNEPVDIILTNHVIENVSYDPDNPGQTAHLVDDIIALGYTAEYANWVVTELIPDTELRAHQGKKQCAARPVTNYVAD